MQFRPLANKTWAGIFIAAVFIVAMYFFTTTVASFKPAPPAMPDTTQAN